MVAWAMGLRRAGQEAVVLQSSHGLADAELSHGGFLSVGKGLGQ